MPCHIYKQRNQSMPFTIKEYEEIFRRCHPRALGISISMLGDGEEARDVAQQVFLNVWETRLKIENPDAFIYRAVRNQCLNRLEQFDTKERLRRQYAIISESVENDAAAEIEDVQAAMASLLSDRERQVMDEIFDKGNSYKDAAANLNLSTSSINKYISSALKTLRLHFKKSRK